MRPGAGLARIEAMANFGRHAARDVLLLSATHGCVDATYLSERHTDMPEDSGVSAGESREQFRDGAYLRVVVRRARLTDLFSLSGFNTRYELNHPGSSRMDSDPVRAVVRGSLPFVPIHHPVFVATAEEGRRVMGFAQCRVVGPDRRWLAESLGTNTGVYDPEPMVSELLNHVIQSAGLDGVKRLYARVEPDSPIKESLHKTGFSPYLRERIMVANSVPVMAAAPGVRVQEQADVWAIHQLYMHTTPREVQYAEALTSHSWDVDAILRTSGHGCCGWLMTDDHLAVGYIRAISRRDAHIVDFMISSEHRDLFPRLVSTAFRELAAQSSRRIYVIVREYQSEFIPFLYELGFGIDVAMETHVKYTTATVRSHVVAGLQPVVDPRKEPSGRRVPTFFHGSIDQFGRATERELTEEWSSSLCGAVEHDE